MNSTGSNLCGSMLPLVSLTIEYIIKVLQSGCSIASTREVEWWYTSNLTAGWDRKKMEQFPLPLPFGHHEYTTKQAGCWWFSAVVSDFDFSKCQSDKRISGSQTYSTRQPLCHEGMAPHVAYYFRQGLSLPCTWASDSSSVPWSRPAEGSNQLKTGRVLSQLWQSPPWRKCYRPAGKGQPAAPDPGSASWWGGREGFNTRAVWHCMINIF